MSQPQEFAADLPPALEFPGRAPFRFCMLHLPSGAGSGATRDEIRAGLASLPTPQVPARHLQDARAQALWDALCRRPEYYPGRLEPALLEAIGPSLAALLGTVQLVELDAGSCRQATALLEAFGAGRRPLSYVAIDRWAQAMGASAAQLVRIYPHLQVLGLVGDCEEAIATLPTPQARLFLWLGGAIGHLEPERQDRQVRMLSRRMGPGDHLLVGFDRRPHAGKPPAMIQQAYNDASGLNAAFTLNALAHLNREQGATFRLSAWSHLATYDEGAHHVELGLACHWDQDVSLAAVGETFHFARGTRLRTAICRTFDKRELAAYFAERGLAPEGTWSDPLEHYSLMLVRKEAA